MRGGLGRALMGAGAILLLICAGSVIRAAVVGKQSMPAAESSSVEAILCTRQVRWFRAKPLHLFLFILNRSDGAVCFDARMSWPGNISLFVKTPTGVTIKACRLSVKMANLTQKGVLSLDAGRLYGVRLTIDPAHDARVARELKDPKKGSYLFWAEYYGHALPSLRCDEVSVKSNPVTVVAY